MRINSFAGIAREHGTRTPDAIALEFEGRTVTFGALHDRSNRVANALAGAGVGPGDRVAFIDRNGVPFFEVLLGASKIGAVTVPINWRLAGFEMRQIIMDSRAKIVIANAEVIAGGLEPGIPVVGIGPREGTLDYDAWAGAAPATDPGVEPNAGDVALQLYTSGTTGIPKGVMLTNDNFFGMIERVLPRWRFDTASVNLAAMPLFHVAGAGWATLGLFQGCRTVLLGEVDPGLIIDLIPRYGVTNALFVPAVIQFLLMAAQAREADFSSLRTVVYGASPISESVLRQAMKVFGCEFIQVYGLTETTGAITELAAGDHDPETRPELLRSCGRPYPWVELRVADPATGADLPAGHVGEILTRSAQVMKGYWNNPAATAETITSDGWLKTGDAGSLDAAGYLFLHDRMKDMIVTGGENVYPAEIENVLMRHPEIADVAVIGVPDERWGEAVKAVVVRGAGSAIADGEVLAFARDFLGGFKIPKSVDFADSLPRNPSGKVLKRILREPYWQGYERQIN